MFDVFLQRETELELPDCGGVFSRKKNPTTRDELLFHYGEVDIKDSFPIAQEIQSAFCLLSDENQPFFSLCDDPRKLDRNSLEKYLQKDSEKVSFNDPIVHAKIIAARPILDLMEKEVKQPTSRVKKFAPRALEYLASHSEDWRNRSFVGVHPQRLRSLVREDKWETYENRLMYTLCKTLNTLITQRLHELRSVDDAYGEIQRYYEIDGCRIDYRTMQQEIDYLLGNYLSEDVRERRERLGKTIKFLERIQQNVKGLWNSQLFNNLKRIPNVEVDINKFIRTNVLMNNQHYRYLLGIQREIVSSYSKEHAEQKRLEGQQQLLSNEITYVLRCIDDIKQQAWWQFLEPEIRIRESKIGVVLECHGKKLRFAFASSRPSDAYQSRAKQAEGNKDEISILIYPREIPYLNGQKEDDFGTLKSIFGNRLPGWGSFSILGISPQSVFSKLLIQKILFQWAWPRLIAQYPVEMPRNRFVDECILAEKKSGKYLFKKCDVSEFRLRISENDRTLPAAEKAFSRLEEANELIDAALKCPCCGAAGILLEDNQGNLNPRNFIVCCPVCEFRWSRNANTIKWIQPHDDWLYGKFMGFEGEA